MQQRGSAFWDCEYLPLSRLISLDRVYPDLIFMMAVAAVQRGNIVEASAYPPYRFVQRQMAAGEHQPSDISKLVEKLEPENGGLER